MPSPELTALARPERSGERRHSCRRRSESLRHLSVKALTYLFLHDLLDLVPPRRSVRDLRPRDAGRCLNQGGPASHLNHPVTAIPAPPPLDKVTGPDTP